MTNTHNLLKNLLKNKKIKFSNFENLYEISLSKNDQLLNKIQNITLKYLRDCVENYYNIKINL